MPEIKAFEAALSFAQSLTGWALLIAGGSIVVLVGTSYYRPRVLGFRLMYLLFLPGWFFLAKCMYFGTKVQRAYLAYLFTTPSDQGLLRAKDAITGDSLQQYRKYSVCSGIFWRLAGLVPDLVAFQ